ncbi:methylaspartate mutase epsilon subunit [Nonomuraea angiospora]|uniref:Methylaspartate mutase epsilon subunit n=2 Tax=Nonomuraea angiospora TaxID=46172 RepID=A0ABR9LNL1_9ACTN|nr:methylaspartate mutase epsilon subunit [Nonomuraea angiospora]
MTMTDVRNLFSRTVRDARGSGHLVVQPRMGFSDVDKMRAGLQAVAALPYTVGTITLDSYTRTGQYEAAHDAVRNGRSLNGYPLLAHGPVRTSSLLASLRPDFPVQLRHGSPTPVDIFASMLEAGIHATEGGPISYCFPYGRTPLNTAVAEWARASELLASCPTEVHLESFAGCMLGQLCPPSLLVALNILEGLFATSYGIRSLSLSYAQQINPCQDIAAIRALRRLTTAFLPEMDIHFVIYTYMGVFPQSAEGARRLIIDSARLARQAGADRLVVKTVSEAFRIPLVSDNIAALKLAGEQPPGSYPTLDDGLSEVLEKEILSEAEAMLEAVLGLAPTVPSAILRAFKSGILDIPFCLHPDNANHARTEISHDGLLTWAYAGRMPVTSTQAHGRRIGATELQEMLGFIRRRYDEDPIAN